jgi:hypothetical protein
LDSVDVSHNAQDGIENKALTPYVLTVVLYSKSQRKASKQGKGSDTLLSGERGGEQ